MAQNRSRKNKPQRSQKRSQKGREFKSELRKRAEHAPAKRDAPATPKRAEGLWLYGTHAVQAALTNPIRKTKQLLATADALNRLPKDLQSLDTIQNALTVERADLDTRLPHDAVHQGIAAQVNPLPDMDITDVLREIAEDEPALVVALDQVTDPHNVGAVLRSAAAFGARALLTTRHNAPEETGVLAKAASGALDVIPIVRATNLKRAFKECHGHGFWTVGLNANADDSIDTMELPHRCVVVLGAEGKGMRQTVQETCDFVASLPMSGDMESLNVSNAAAISLYEWQRQQRTR